VPGTDYYQKISMKAHSVKYAVGTCQSCLLLAAAALAPAGAAVPEVQLPKRTIAAAPTTLGAPALFGQWSDVQPWPVIPIHANLMPNGKVIAWDATPDDFDDDPHTTENYTTRVTVWDPQRNTFISANNDTNADLFCAGSSHLWDGRIIFAGGDSGIGGLNGPLSNTSIYDPDTNTWEQMEDMAAPRWYSSNAALANGETLTYAGTYAPAPVAEVFQHDETWRSLGIPTLPELSINYQWMQTIPDGRVMTFGPQNTLATIDPQGNGIITPGQQRDQYPQRHYGSYAMYDIGKVIVSGGTEDEGGPFSYDSTLLIDTATQQVTATSPMTFARSQHNLTILADGSVLASGGNTSGAALIDLDAGVLRPEIWSPDTGQWQVMNDMQIDRQYHSVALLLPDATVLSAGGGYCGTCYEEGYEEQNAEIFSPPYLFSEGATPATRPQIGLAPESIDYDAMFSLTTPDAASIARVHLVKLGSVTHSMNQDQRLIPLSFRREGNALRISGPATRNIAPPGHYMLFILNNDGVPSEAAITLVGQPKLRSGQTVRHTAKAGKTDQYEIASTAADKALLVTISNQTATTRLRVYGETADNRTTARCDTRAAVSETLECRLSNETATRWLLEVTAATDTDYEMSGTLSTTPDPLALTPGTEGQQSGVVRTGGGSIALLLLSLLMLPRRRC
jgi:hypothetical protein